MLGTIFYWAGSTLFNPVAIILLASLIYQMVYKRQGTGLIISSIFVLLNLFMVLALVSDLAKVSNPDANYYKQLIFGTLFLGFNLVSGIFMFWTYIKTYLTE